MIVYWDVFFAVNFIIDLLLLACTAYLLSKKISLKRIFLGATIGALYALTPFFKTTFFLDNAFFKIAIPFVMVATSIYFKSIFDYLKAVLLFFAVSSFLAGASFAIENLGENIFVATQMKFTGLLLTILLVIFAISLLYFRFRGVIFRSLGNAMLKITFGEKTVIVQGLIDTGNELCCPISGKPVIVVNSLALKEVLPNEILKGDEITKLDELSEYWKSRLQLMPYSALGKRGVILAVRPDNLEVRTPNSKNFTQVSAVLGLTRDNFCRDKSYEALIGAQILSFTGV